MPIMPSQPQGVVAISLFTSSDLAASFSTTGVRPSHTTLRPAVVAVPTSPALSYSWSTTITLASRPTPLPLRYTAFSPLPRMSITQSTPTTTNLFTSGYAAISPPSPGTCPLRPCSSPRSYQYVAFSTTPDSPSHPSYQIWPHWAGVCGSYQLWLHPWLCPLCPDNCFPRIHPFVWFPTEVLPSSRQVRFSTVCPSVWQSAVAMWSFPLPCITPITSKPPWSTPFGIPAVATQPFTRLRPPHPACHCPRIHQTHPNHSWC